MNASFVLHMDLRETKACSNIIGQISIGAQKASNPQILSL